MKTVNVNDRAAIVFAIDELRAVAPGEARAELVSRLVSRVYVESPAALRARLLERLMRPIGPLALTAIAAGAFARFVHRGAWSTLAEIPGGIEHIGGEQVFELARFVEQVQPDAIEQLARVLAEHPMSLHTLAGAMLFLALRLWSTRRREDDD
ncbi:MAG: hypothetical protein AB7P21_26020 [Lautropia sp.]